MPYTDQQNIHLHAKKKYMSRIYTSVVTDDRQNINFFTHEKNAIRNHILYTPAAMAQAACLTRVPTSLGCLTQPQ